VARRVAGCSTPGCVPTFDSGRRLLPALRGGGGGLRSAGGMDGAGAAPHAPGADDSEERRSVAAPDDAQPCDDDEAELDAWLSGWQGGGVARKRKREDATAAGEPGASTLVKTRRTAGNAIPAPAQEMAQPQPRSARRTAAIDGQAPAQDPNAGQGDSGEDFEAAMRAAGAKEGKRTDEGKEGTDGNGERKPKGSKSVGKSKEKESKSAMRPQQWPTPKQKRHKTEADAQAEDALFLKKVHLLEEEFGGAKGLFIDGNITEQYTIPNYELLEPGVPPPLQFRFNRSDDMAEPEPYEWDDYRCEFDTVWSPFPKNNTLITTINGISVRVQTHPRRKDQVHLRPTAPDVYYALNHELLETPRGVRWEVKVTGLPHNASIEQLRRLLAAQRDKQQSRPPRREIPAFTFGVPAPEEVDVQHITLSHGDCARALSHEFPWGLDESNVKPPGRHVREVKSAIVTCSTAHGARCVAEALMDVRALQGEEAEGWQKVQVSVERLEEMVDDSWAEECAEEGAGGVLVDDGGGAKTYRVAGKLGMEAIDPVTLWGKAVERVRRVPEDWIGGKGPGNGQRREHVSTKDRSARVVRGLEAGEDGGDERGQDRKASTVSKGTKGGDHELFCGLEAGGDEGRLGAKSSKASKAREGGDYERGQDGEGGDAAALETGGRTVLVHNLLFNYEEHVRELLGECGTLQSLRFKWLPDFRCYTARVRFSTRRAAQNAVKLSGTLCMGRRAVIELVKEGASIAALLAPDAMRLKTQYQPPPDGPPMQVTARGREAPHGSPEHIDLNTLNTPRNPEKDLLDDSHLKLAEGFELRKLPRCEVERLLPGWTYSIDNRPRNGSWYLPSSQGYGNFSGYSHHQEVERALVSRLLYPETIKIIVRGDPAALFGHRQGDQIPDPFVEIGGVSHDQGVLPIHPEACGAARPVYVCSGDYYSVPTELLMRRFAKLEQDIRRQEQYRGIPRVTAAASGEMSYLKPTDFEVDPLTGELQMPFPTAGRGFMDSYLQYASGP